MIDSIIRAKSIGEREAQFEGFEMSSINRAIQAVDLLSRKAPMGVRAVAQQLGLPVASVHRMLADLEKEDVVARTPSGEWDLSFRLLQITGRQLDRAELPRLTRPFAEKIAAATRETVNLNAVAGIEAVCIDKVRGNERMQLDFNVGSRGPIHCGGAGKAILAYLPEAKRELVLAGPLTRLTPKTLTDRAAVERELLRIRARGYAIDDQEVVTGVFCVAVPILDRDGYAVGAISITGPAHKAPGKEIEPLVAMLSEAGEYASRRIGYAGVWLNLAGELRSAIDKPTRSTLSRATRFRERA